jgi:hypothetical protein
MVDSTRCAHIGDPTHSNPYSRSAGYEPGLLLELVAAN